MQMVGQTIDARSPFSWAVPFFVLIAAGLIAWAVMDSNPHPALAAALPRYNGNAQPDEQACPLSVNSTVKHAALHQP